MKKSMSRARRVSSRTIAILVIVLAVLIVFYRYLSIAIYEPIVIALTVVTIVTLAIAVFARYKKRTILGLIRSYFPKDDDEGLFNPETDEDPDDDIESPWAPIIEDDSVPSDIILVKNIDGATTARKIPPKGKRYNRRLELVDVPRTTEDIISELLEKVTALEETISPSTRKGK